MLPAMPDTGHAWADLVSLAVHELRTPVSVASGYVKMVLGGHGGPLSDAQRGALAAADQSNAKAIELLAELSELARLETGRMALSTGRVTIEDLLADAVARFSPPLGSPVRCFAPGPVPPVTIDGDRTRLARALAVLAAASSRNRPQAPAIVLSAHVRAGHVALLAAAATIEVPAGAADTDDLGPLPETEGGLGVGLPLARVVVHLSGGRIGVPRGGDARGEFAVVLPLA